MDLKTNRDIAVFVKGVFAQRLEALSLETLEAKIEAMSREDLAELVALAQEANSNELTQAVRAGMREALVNG